MSILLYSFRYLNQGKSVRMRGEVYRIMKEAGAAAMREQIMGREQEVVAFALCGR